MTRSALKAVATASLAALALAMAGCDTWVCWLNNTQAAPLNPNYLQPTGAVQDVADRPVFVSVSPGDAYVAVSSYGDGSGLGSLAIVRADGSSPVSQAPIGDRPYGLAWIGTNRLLVCNEGLAAVGGDARLLSVTLTRGSADPADEAYDDLTLGDPNDPGAAVPIAPDKIVGPSEIASVPGTNLIVLVTLRFPSGLFQVNLAGDSAVSKQLLPVTADGVDPLDEPRGIDVTPDGTVAWICNYGDGADNQASLALAHELIAAKLNQLRGALPFDDATLNETIAAADQWIVDHRDPDGRLPARWAEPNDEPNQQAQTDAANLAAALLALNADPNCTDPADANCPLSSAQWAMLDPNDWPTDANVAAGDDEFMTLVLGDPNEPNDLDRYTYANVLTILQRAVGENGTITLYNLALEQLAASVVVPPRPRSIRITSDGAFAVVACAGNDGLTGSVAIVSVAGQAVVVQRALPFIPAHIRLSPLGGRAYISGWTGDQLAVINLKGLCTSVMPEPRDTRFYPAADRPAPLDASGNADVLWGGSITQGQVFKLDAFEGAVRVPQ